MIAIKTGSPARTPTKSPAKKMMQISQAQKQALIDNLQLESMFLTLQAGNFPITRLDSSPDKIQ